MHTSIILNNPAGFDELKEPEIQNAVIELKFERIIELAAIICGVSKAMIAFVDKTNNWFTVGEGKIIIEPFKKIDFFNYVLSSEAFFEVEDAAKDDRFNKYKLMMGYFGICFYSGVPIKDQSGKIWGVLSVSESSPKRLTINQKKALKLLAAKVVNVIENIKLNESFEGLAKAYSKSVVSLKRSNQTKRKMGRKEELNRAMVQNLLGPANNIQMIIDLIDGAAFDEENAYLLSLLKITGKKLNETLRELLQVFETVPY